MKKAILSKLSLVAIGAAVALFVGAGSASAQYAGSLTVSDSTVTVGQVFTVSGNCAPGSDRVVFTLVQNGQQVLPNPLNASSADFGVNADGSFSNNAVVYASVANGTYQLTATCSGGGGVLTTDITVVGSAQQLTEAGLYGLGFLFLLGLVGVLYVYGPKAKRTSAKSK